jgi:hypothetical protein
VVAGVIRARRRRSGSSMPAHCTDDGSAARFGRYCGMGVRTRGLDIATNAVAFLANEMAQILGVQCFLARTALGWNVSQLGRAAEVSYHTIERFEREGSARPSTVEAIQRALEKAGVIFIDANDGGPGARLGG